MSTGANDRVVVLSLGMGIDSVALLLRWIVDPTCRPFDLQNLILVTAMTGDEHPATYHLMQRYLLPILRRFGVRYVQLCRGGQRAKHRYVVLSDSRATGTMQMQGPWRLSDEMRSAGTLPSVRRGRRWCSDRAKGEVIDWWVNDNCPAGYIHVTGYAAEEGRRSRRDAKARKEKELTRKVVACQPSYPLMDWGWNREKCAAYITEVMRRFWQETVIWHRSCCTFCPFQGVAGSRAELVARWRAQPEAAADAIELERTALRLNKRIGLFGVGRTAQALARDEQLDDALAAADQREDSLQRWRLVELRRVFSEKDGDRRAKGRAWRSVRVRATGTREAMHRKLERLRGTTVTTDENGITRAWRTILPAQVETYPAVEWLWVVTPETVVAKQMPGFEAEWTRAHTQQFC